jgi:hypothetical protein
MSGLQEYSNDKVGYQLCGSWVTSTRAMQGPPGGSWPLVGVREEYPEYGSSHLVASIIGRPELEGGRGKSVQSGMWFLAS